MGDILSVSRTLVKSEPELASLVSSTEHLSLPGVEVTLTEKGFGTRVAITAAPPSSLSQADLEALLDELGGAHKRPFVSGLETPQAAPPA